ALLRDRALKRGITFCLFVVATKQSFEAWRSQAELGNEKLLLPLSASAGGTRASGSAGGGVRLTGQEGKAREGGESRASRDSPRPLFSPAGRFSQRSAGEKSDYSSCRGCIRGGVRGAPPSKESTDAARSPEQILFAGLARAPARLARGDRMLRVSAQ